MLEDKTHRKLINTAFVPEVQVLERKLSLYNPSCFHSGVQNILLTRHVVRCCQPVQIIEVTKESEKKW